MTKHMHRRIQPQDAGTGRYVTIPYAERHPRTTVWITPKRTRH